MLTSISVFIPIYNEEDTLYDVVLEMQKYLKNRKIDYEILLIDDASNDGSLKIMEMLSIKDAKIKYLHFNRKQGLGALMKKGYNYATKDWVMMISADGQFRPKHLEHYFAYSNNYDIIAGNRWERYDQYSISRKIVSKIFNFIGNCIFKIPIHDVGWSKLVKRSVLQDVILKQYGAIVELELVVKALLHRYRIHEVDVPFIPRSTGVSKCFNIKQVLISTISCVCLYFEILKISKAYNKKYSLSMLD